MEFVCVRKGRETIKGGCHCQRCKSLKKRSHQFSSCPAHNWTLMPRACQVFNSLFLSLSNLLYIMIYNNIQYNYMVVYNPSNSVHLGLFSYRYSTCRAHAVEVPWPIYVLELWTMTQKVGGSSLTWAGSWENSACSPSSKWVPDASWGRLGSEERGMSYALHMLCPRCSGAPITRRTYDQQGYGILYLYVYTARAEMIILTCLAHCDN